MKPANLPRPNEFGAYWLGRRGHGPAVLPCKRVVRDKYGSRIEATGQFIASLDDERGFIFEGTNLRRFGSALEAYRAIQGK